MPRKILLIHYFAGAGGKFIGNCLSMSGQVAFPNYYIIKKYHEIKKIEIVQDALLDTIPEKSKHREWMSKEQGNVQLFGPGMVDVQIGIETRQFLYDLSMFNDFWLPVQSHSKHSFDSLVAAFQTDQVFRVLVKGDPTFIDRAIRLKWREEHCCLDLDLFSKFNQDLESMQFDHVIESWNPLELDKLQEIETLAGKLEINYSNSMAQTYIDLYRNFHF